MVIVLAVSRERCVFHLDRIWTSTRGGVWLMWTHVDKGEEVKIRFFCGRHKWMAPSVYNPVRDMHLALCNVHATA